jgi:hypothetical protein
MNTQQIIFLVPAVDDAAAMARLQVACWEEADAGMIDELERM